MKHYGDITKLNGYDLPVVDIVTGGSPCQDLSIAGKRAGLAGERSGLFMEQIRIIKELREHDRTDRGSDVDMRLLRPRYMVWENVPGAFSSNKGEDFRAVLEETARIVEKDAVIPRHEGKWTPSGCIMGNGWSIAWRVHDAQFWGVPQRRKRIALVADFGGSTAPEILFERKGVSGDITEGEEAGEEAAGAARENPDPAIYDVRISSDGTRNWRAHAYEATVCRNLDTGGVIPTATTEGLRSSVICLNDQGGSWMNVSEKVTGSLRAEEHGHQPIVYGISSYDSNAMKSDNPNSGIYEAETTRTLDNNGGNPACNQGGMVVLEGNGSRPSHRGDGYNESETMYTLNSTEHHAVCVSQDAYDKYTESEKSATITQSGGVYGGVAKPLLSTMQAIGEYKIGGVASALKQRDYKDATDLVIQ